jgi:hypothetical protein
VEWPYWTLFVIVTSDSTALGSRRRNTIKYGPSPISKSLLVVGAVFSLVYWFEPTLLFRALDFWYSHPQGIHLCIVPPYWWLEIGQGLGLAHGWASFMDILQWLGGFGLLSIFIFMKNEYNRNIEVLLY